ncbi:IQ calmodulin-binding motif-containing protein [Vibrio tetraodonis]|uniref:IQ calmodulin-binding motif-containing protein n=1 Tax=Vibrio tetraodonis TaxID=2231647 RepID=UPI000E09F096|nr:IQ calmodulin-binding motif-containing protein [Vibrio tetraodonis]
MNLTIRQIHQHITTKHNALQATDNNNEFILTLPVKKVYRVLVDADGKATSVIRENPKQLFGAKCKTSIANFLSKSNNAKALKVLQKMDMDCGQIINECNKDNAVTTIQAAFRGFVARRSLTPENDFGFKKMTNENHGRTYYFDSTRENPHLRTPDHRVKFGSAGAFKTVTHADSSFVQLSNPSISLEAAKNENQLADELSQFSSVCHSRYVEDKTVLARNGGSEIADQRRKYNRKFPLESFRLACQDLAAMHNLDIYMRDIKPENMVIKDGVARHIDLDFVTTPNGGTYPLEQLCGTPYMITKGMIKERESGDKERIKKALKSGDQFAMLQTIMYATGGSKLSYQVRRHDGIGKMGVAITNAHKDWARDNILPQHKNHVLKFLANPTASPLPAPLHLLIKWDN